jgi:glutamine amidotransferase
MIAIVDYGMGNLRSVQKGLEKVGSGGQIVRTAAEILAADKVILPGVGAFGDAMKHLGELGLVQPLREFAASGRPFLGVCLGLQLLFEVSHEEGEFTGLGILPGSVERFDFTHTPAGRGLKVPHMGWNQVHWTQPSPLLAGIESGAYFYFVHSYYAVPADERVTLGLCDYGYRFAAIVHRDNIFATQFHPEKSQAAGLQILRNFAAL